MFFSFSSSAKGQTTQTTPLIEARQEKTREFQTQLLHYFSKSKNKSNHHRIARSVLLLLSSNGSFGVEGAVAERKENRNSFLCVLLCFIKPILSRSTVTPIFDRDKNELSLKRLGGRSVGQKHVLWAGSRSIHQS